MKNKPGSIEIVGAGQYYCSDSSCSVSSIPDLDSHNRDSGWPSYYSDQNIDPIL